MRSSFVIAAAAAAALTAACARHTATAAASDAGTPAAGAVALPADSPMLKQIASAPVRLVDLPTDEVVAPGKIEANPGRVAKIVLPVGGRVTSVLVKTGDSVRRDQPLLTIQSPDADAAVSAYLTAAAGVAQAEAAQGKAQADRDRVADLFDHNAVARKEVLTADSTLAQTKAALDQARAAREQAARRMAVLGLTPGEPDSRVTVRSPLGGKILDLAVVAGEYRSDTTASVMTVADLTTVWVSSQVPESYIRFVQRGEEIAVSLVAYPGEVFTGHVSRIADTVDPQSRTVKVQAEMDNRDGRLRPEMYGSIHHVESTAPTTVVPVGAVVQQADASIVFVETAPGRFEPRTVTLGKRAAADVRVTNGLEPGELVAVDGVMLLQGLLKRS